MNTKYLTYKIFTQGIVPHTHIYIYMFSLIIIYIYIYSIYLCTYILSHSNLRKTEMMPPLWTWICLRKPLKSVVVDSANPGSLLTTRNHHEPPVTTSWLPPLPLVDYHYLVDSQGNYKKNKPGPVHQLLVVKYWLLVVNYWWLSTTGYILVQ